MNSPIGFIALGIVVVTIVAIAQRLIRKKEQSFPFAKRKYFFSAAERSFYEVLRRMVPDHVVFAKVRLADLVYVKKGESDWRSHQNRIDRKHVDFVICNADLAPLVAVELDDSSHNEQRRSARDAFVDKVMASAGIAMVRIPAQRGYQLDSLRKLLSPHLAV